MLPLQNKSKEELQTLLNECKEIEKNLHSRYYSVSTRKEVEREYRANQRKAIKIANALKNYDELHKYKKPSAYTKNIITGENIKENEVLRKDW